MARDPWSIEKRQHHRRDRTQDEDRCTVRETNTARNLSLFRTVAISCAKLTARAEAASSPSGILNAGLAAVPGA